MKKKKRTRMLIRKTTINKESKCAVLYFTVTLSEEQTENLILKLLIDNLTYVYFYYKNSSFDSRILLFFRIFQMN